MELGPLSPSIPEESEGTPTNGLMCFLNDKRECGADCMAFTAEPNESPNLSMQQRNCVLLVAVERLGRYHGGISSMLNKIYQRSTDQARQGAPPNPLGKS